MRSMIWPSSAGLRAGAGDNAPMPPVLGPVSPSPRRLKSWAVASGSTFLAIDQGEKARLLALEKIFDNDFPPRLPETAFDQGGVDRSACRIEIRGNRDPLARGKPIDLDDDRRAALGDEGFGCDRVAKAPVVRQSGCRRRRKVAS